MSEPTFYRLMMAEWPAPTEEERRAHDAVEEYDRRCDSYDRFMCGPAGMPRDAFEMAAINRNAREVRTDVLAKYNVSASLFKEALQRKRREK